MNINYENVARNIRQIRKDKELSQQAVAKKAGVTKATISLIESRKLDPSPLLIKKVTEALGSHTLEIHSFEAEKVAILEKIIDSVKDSYEVSMPIELSDIEAHFGNIDDLIRRSKDFYFKTNFLDAIIKFFASLNQETNSRLFQKNEPYLSDIASFLLSLPHNVLQEAIGNRVLYAAENDPYTGREMGVNIIEDENCLDFYKEDPPLNFSEISFPLSKQLGVSLVPKNANELRLEETIKILKEREDILAMIYLIIKKLHQTPQISFDFKDLFPLVKDDEVTQLSPYKSTLDLWTKATSRDAKKKRRQE